MDTATYIQEEFIMQNIVLIIFGIFFLIALVGELFQRKNELDDIAKMKLKKIYQFAYVRLFNGNREETKKNTIAFCKEVHRKRLVNEKYDLIKGA